MVQRLHMYLHKIHLPELPQFVCLHWNQIRCWIPMLNKHQNQLQLQTTLQVIPMSFAACSFALKMKRHRKYGCKLCMEVLNSAHLLTIHHRQSHGILYCDVCNKVFNNPTSLVRHNYQHRPLRFHCACSASFAFSSQLQTHSVVHCHHALHHCVYPKCNRSFKNKGDLKRHAAEHYGDLHECPDGDYKNRDVRNLESHRLKHSDIKKYMCKSSGQGEGLICGCVGFF